MQSKKKRLLKFSEAINESLAISMSKNKNVIIMGLGVDDPKRIFGTTKNLIEKFGSNRVFEMPTAENCMTGLAIGASISKIRPVITHQRVEFALLSMDQIVNQAANWSYMSSGKMNVPIVIRLIIGRGWGQGPQHSQTLESMFASIPGLKVVCPSSPADAKGMLSSAIRDNNPVIFFEHRWLHQIEGFVKKKDYQIPIGKCNIKKKGNDITLVSNSYMTIECIKLYKVFEKLNISVEHIDLRTLRPLDINSIINSVKKTKKMLVVENGLPNFGISSEIITKVSSKLKNIKTDNFSRIGFEETPIPSTRSLAKYCYPRPYDICSEILKVLKIQNKNLKFFFKNKGFEDVPDLSFTGPF